MAVSYLRQEGVGSFNDIRQVLPTSRERATHVEMRANVSSDLCFDLDLA